MTKVAPSSLWALAFTGSLGFHCTVAAALILVPKGASPEITATEISIQSIPLGDPERVATVDPAQPLTPSVSPVASAVVPQSVEAVRQDPAESVAAPADKAVLAPAAEQEVAASPPSQELAVTAAGREVSAVARPDEAAVAPGAERDVAPAIEVEAAQAPQVAAKIADAVTPSRADAPVTEVDPSIVTQPTAPETLAADAVEVARDPALVAQERELASADTGPAPDAQMVVRDSLSADIAAPSESAPLVVGGEAAAPTKSAPAPMQDVVREKAAVSAASGAAKVAAVEKPAAGAVAALPSQGAASRVTGQIAVPGSVVAAPVVGASPPAIGPVVQAVPSKGGQQTLAMVVPDRPAIAAAEQSPAQRYAKVLGFLSQQGDANCFVAVAAPGGADAITVDGFAPRTAEVTRLGEELGQISGARIAARAHPVSTEQCGALAFARGVSQGYPEFGLDVRLDLARFASGGTLSGDIGRATRNWLYLLVVDDEGKVQEVEDITMEPTGKIAFKAPVTLTNGRVDTVQLLIAIASDTPIGTIAALAGSHAESFFPALSSEIARAGNKIDLGVASFTLE